MRSHYNTCILVPLYTFWSILHVLARLSTFSVKNFAKASDLSSFLTGILFMCIWVKFATSLFASLAGGSMTKFLRKYDFCNKSLVWCHLDFCYTFQFSKDKKDFLKDKTEVVFVLLIIKRKKTRGREREREMLIEKYLSLFNNQKREWEGVKRIWY